MERTTILIAILLALILINAIVSACKYIREKRFRKMVERLFIRLILKSGCNGHMRFPSYGEEMVYDADLGCNVYEFVEIRNDNMQRTFLISKDGEHIKALPWRNDNIEIER